MKPEPFKLEKYFARYEFAVKYLLSSSDCDGLLQKELIETADNDSRKMWEELTLGYTESAGHPKLRGEIAQLYTGIQTDQCLVAVPEEGVFMTMNTILGPGDHIISTFPGYQSLYEIARSLGCEVSLWKPREENGWRFDPDEAAGMIRPNTKMLVVNFPHNPTGYLPGKEDFARIIDLARKNGLYLFSDEMYRMLEQDPKDRLPAAAEEYEKGITLSGMSKIFGMAGVRIGWLVTKDRELYKKLAAFKDYTTICSSAPSEILSIMALRRKNEIISQNMGTIKRNLAELDRFFSEFGEQFSWVKPKTGTIGFPRIKTEIGATELCERVVRDTNIMLLPSTVYDYDDRHFRLGFGRKNMPEALEILRKYLRG